MENIEELIYAAEHGSTEAMYELGMMYYSGDGVAEDERESMKWLKRAAAKGDQIAEEIYRQWNTQKRDEYLVRLLGDDYIAKYGRAVVLHCPTCGKACTEPLPQYSTADFKWVHLVAYDNMSMVECVRYGLGQFKVGKRLKMYIYYPIYCKIGDFFPFQSVR